MDRIIKVAVSQRICPDWRVPVFQELANRDGIDLTVFFGEGLQSGANRNADKIEGFKYKKLFTIPIYFHDQGVEKYRSFHPTLPFHLLFGGYDVVIVEPSTNFFNNLLIYPLCKIFGKSFIWYEAGSPEHRSRLRRMIDPLLNIMIRGAHGYITYNSFADQTLMEMGIAKEKIFRAQNTLDSRQIMEDAVKYQPYVSRLRRELGVHMAKVVLFIGGIEKRKRIENLIGAASILQSEGVDVRILIVGDGPYEAELKARLSPEERAWTVFAGRHVEDAVLYILASDVVVLPGQGGLSINHAFACGKPCIATPEAVAGGPSVYDYIQDGENGFVVKANDVLALANVMKLLFEDENLYRKLCQGALETAKQLTIQRMVDGIEGAVRYAMRT